MDIIMLGLAGIAVFLVLIGIITLIIDIVKKGVKITW
jgi:hypothetical protein